MTAESLGQSVPKLDGIHLMDGIEGLLRLPRHSVDMLLTDPPYGTTRNFWDVPLPLPELWEAVRWAVKPNGAILFFAQCPFDKVLGASNLAMLRYEWVWYKSRATGFLNANRAPLKKSENILVFYQKSPVYHPQFTYGEPYRKTNPRSGCSTNYGKFERTGSESSDGRRYPGNVLFVPTVTGGIHPTQKPVELCEYFIKTYTDEGAVVADICAGSGTTAVAAMNTHRRFICFENAPSIYTIAAQRIEQSLSRFAVRLGGIVAHAARFTVFGRNGGGEGEDRTNRRLDLVRVQQLAERLRAAQEQRGGEQHCGNAGGDEQGLLFLVHGWGSFPTSNLLLPSNRGEGDRFPTVYLIKSFLASPSSGVT